MNAWQIYWVMQLDTIGNLLFVVALVGIITSVFMVPIGMGMCATREKDEQEMGAKVKRAGKQIMTAGLVSAVACGFLPSTQTAAAMVVIPAIANNETIRKEAGDLYAIAKQGLRELVKPVAPEPKK